MKLDAIQAHVCSSPSTSPYMSYICVLIQRRVNPPSILHRKEPITEKAPVTVDHNPRHVRRASFKKN